MRAINHDAQGIGQVFNSLVVGDSRPWKADLWRIADRLTARTVQVRWTELSYINLEKDVFLGFFIIRKLLEARKLSVQVESTPVRVMAQPWKGNHRITHLNWDRFDSDAYDWSAAANETLPLLDLCNLFVHSCIYVPLMSDDRQLEGLFVSSDRSRHQKLFYIDAIQTVALLRAVANDSAEQMEAKRYGRTGDYVVRLSRSLNRPGFDGG
jgi:hypothetical protein